jgi:hypothetical protein
MMMRLSALQYFYAPENTVANIVKKFPEDLSRQLLVSASTASSEESLGSQQNLICPARKVWIRQDSHIDQDFRTSGHDSSPVTRTEKKKSVSNVRETANTVSVCNNSKQLPGTSKPAEMTAVAVSTTAEACIVQAFDVVPEACLSCHD